MKKKDLKELIEKAKGVLTSTDKHDPSYAFLTSYIEDAERILPDISGRFTSHQKEVYNKLEAAVGPGKNYQSLYSRVSRVFYISRNPASSLTVIPASTHSITSFRRQEVAAGIHDYTS